MPSQAAMAFMIETCSAIAESIMFGETPLTRPCMQVSCEELKGNLGPCAADIDMGILTEGLSLVQGNWPLPRYNFPCKCHVESHAASFGSGT